MRDIDESTTKVHSATISWGKAMGGVAGMAKNMLGVFTRGMGILSFAGAITDAVSLNQEMSDLSYQMGKGGENARFLEKSVYGIQTATGMATDEITDMVTQLAQLRVADEDMKQLAVDSLNFSNITGVSTAGIAEMTGKLSLLGGLGADSISSVMGNIVQTQRQFGMTGASVESLTGSIVETTSVLKNMGKSSKDIEKFHKGTIKLAGAFESVGLEATDATNIIERLLDPSKLQDNAYLYSKLGISIQDAIEGNIDPESVIGGLQNIGAELQNMSGPVAAQMAEQMGIPLNTLRQMGDVDMAKTMAQQMGLVDASADMQAKQEEQAKTQKDMSQMWNKIKGSLGQIVSALMPAFNAISKVLSNNMEGILGFINGMVGSGMVEKFVGGLTKGIKFIGGMLKKINPKVLLVGLAAVLGGIFLMKKKFASVSTESSTIMKKSFRSITPDIGSAIEDGVVGGMEMAAEKSSSIFTEKMIQAGRLVADNHQRRVEAGHQHAALSASQSYQKHLAGQNTWGWAKKMNENTEAWLGKIKASAKPTSLLGEIYQKISNSIQEKGKLQTSQIDSEMQFLKQANQERGESLRVEQERFDILEALGIERTTAQEAEFKHVKNLKTELQAKFKEDKDRIDKLNGQRKKTQTEFLGRLTRGEQVQLAAENSRQMAEKETNQLKIQSRIDDLAGMKESLAASKSIYEQAERELLIKKENGTLSSAEALQLGDIRDRLRENNALNIENVANQESATAELVASKEEMKELVAEAEGLGQVMGEVGDAEIDNAVGKKFKGFGENLSDLAKGAVGLLGTSASEFINKTGQSFKNAGEAIKGAFNEQGLRGVGRHLLRSAGKGALKMGKGAIKAGKKMAKRMGGAALDFAKKLKDATKEKSKEALKGMGKGLAMAGGALLMGALAKSEAGKKMMEKLQGVMTSLMEKLGPTFEKLMPIIDKLVAFLMPLVEKVAGIISGLIEKMMPVIESLMAKLMPVISAIMKAVMPLLATMMDAMMPLFETLATVFMDLVGSLLPAIMPLLDVFMTLLGSLVQTLMPPLLKILGFLLKMGGYLIKAIGGMVTGLSKLFPSLKSTGEAITSAGEGMISAGVAVGNAADRMSGSALKLAGVLENGKLVEALDELEFDGLKKNVGDLTDTLGITSEQATSMSHSELVEEIKSNGKRTELVDQMFENTNLRVS